MLLFLGKLLPSFLGKLNYYFLSLDNVYALLKQEKAYVLKSFLISILIQIVRISFHITLIISLGINIKVWLLAIFVPIALIITMLPITINGIVISENMYSHFFGFVGVEAHEAIAFFWLVLTFASLIPGICGAAIFTLNRKRSLCEISQ